MERKFHSLETFFSSKFSAEFRVHHRLFVDFYSHPTDQREYTRLCTRPPLLISSVRFLLLDTLDVALHLCLRIILIL
jgi:hypothetical protein